MHTKQLQELLWVCDSLEAHTNDFRYSTSRANEKVDVMDKVQTLGGGKRFAYDLDEIEEEQRERA
ncbi:hypothetical protein G4B88_008457 [Cannabis sativa]|uniref:Uncharacterized protein n=1 Tax=Cannabis sativa TaxID=3483 RepID=A0A7J6E9H2_CANSA|nr:hypothetical protein G4B88_008457 [Cannabis sativa]